MNDHNIQKRGQTLPEYALAFGIFFVAIIITLSISVSLFQPFQTSAQEISESDRIANQLVQSTFISDTGQKYVTSDECVVTAVQMFQEPPDSTPLENCQYDDSIETLTYKEYLGIENVSGARIRVIDEERTTVTYNSVDLEFGDDVPTQAQTSRSVRFITINNNIYQLEVVSW